MAAIVGRLAVASWTGTLNVASGRSYTYADVIDGVSQAVGRRPGVASRPRTKRKVNHAFVNGAITTLFPEFTFTRLAEGIARTVAAFSAITPPTTSVPMEHADG